MPKAQGMVAIESAVAASRAWHRTMPCLGVVLDTRVVLSGLAVPRSNDSNDWLVIRQLQGRGGPARGDRRPWWIAQTEWAALVYLGNWSP